MKLITNLAFCSRQYSVDYKLETYMKIARLYLEDDDPVQAEAYINRASLLQVHRRYLCNEISPFVINLQLFCGFYGTCDFITLCICSS